MTEKKYQCKQCGAEFQHDNKFRGGRPPQTCQEHRIVRKRYPKPAKKESVLESTTEAFV